MTNQESKFGGDWLLDRRFDLHQQLGSLSVALCAVQEEFSKSQQARIAGRISADEYGEVNERLSQASQAYLDCITQIGNTNEEIHQAPHDVGAYLRISEQHLPYNDKVDVSCPEEYCEIEDPRIVNLHSI